MKSNTLNNN